MKSLHLLSALLLAGAGAAANEQHYVFAYFYGGARQNEGLHLAVGRDGFAWTPVAGDSALFHPGFGERFRDPSLVRDPDGKRIHLVWTTETPNAFGIATTTDLIHWEDAREVPVMAAVPGTINTWAPELFRDAPRQRWIAYWGSSVAGRFPETAKLSDNPKANNRMYFATSPDLRTWSEPRLWFDFGFPSNDAYLLATPGNPRGDYALFVKHIVKPGVRAHIRLAFASSPEGPWRLTDERVSGDHDFCEGPAVLRIGEAWYCYFDLSRKDHMAVSRATGIGGCAWEDVTARLTLPAGAKHGSILPIDEATFLALKRLPPATGAIRTENLRIRDPFILPDPERGVYYLYRQIGNGRGDTTVEPRGVEVFTSRDLETWQGPKPVFMQPPGFWADAEVWAPEVHHHNGKYHLFVTFSSDAGLPGHSPFPGRALRERGTQVLVADSPEGPFRPFADKAHTPPDWMALDGTFWFEDGQPWMVFCHEWVQVGDGTIELMPLSDDLSKATGPPRTLFKGSSAPWVKSPPRAHGGHVTDGPFLHRTTKGKLLMLWSTHGPDGYTILIAESSSGKIKGPWVQQPEPLFAGDGGHGMLFRAFDGGLALALHQPNTRPLERMRLHHIHDDGDTLRIIRQP